MAKINVNTESQLSFADATRKYVEAGKDLEGKGFDPRKLLAPGAEAIKATVKEKMELFGSVGKAWKSVLWKKYGKMQKNTCFFQPDGLF